ncbi:PREDICTED: DNA repair protein REV1 [Ceratosolen solmsi marchali]|uniref:DNA repair protein REV1 n=1 Tax=Ceratosolen solmsi marchali TaxID=326594 RepID=A0AAJ6VMA3_9HYME|nr:PREDICTED: DNA repair protein REV1 [Ceratosolen solmsi marchali]
MAQKKKNVPWTDCCKDWGDYMEAKKCKLEEQFQEAAKQECTNVSTLFNGIAIFVNGYTNPSAEELKRIMMSHGGIYHHYLRSKGTTHMIASNLPYSKIIAYRKARNPLPLCKPEWITDSIQAGKVLDFRKYLLYSQCTDSQPSIVAQMLKKTKSDTRSDAKQNVESAKLTTNKDIQSQIQGTSKEQIPSGISNCTKNPEFLTEFYNNSRLHHIATMGAMFKDYINDLRDKNNKIFPGLMALKMQSSRNSSKTDPSNRIDDSDSDDNLFYNNQCASNINPTMPSITEKTQIIMHIDMDCFFVSVGLRDHPELRGFPIAVAHAKGNIQRASINPNNINECGSMSEIASCSYEARQAGVKNGMLLGQALKLCPNLKTIKYNFNGYKEVSYALYDTIASYTLDIEAVSCDEMYVDCTKILQISGLNPLDFASIIRKEIKEKTGCPVSTGFGENKLQARLATKKAKPNGQFYLKQDCVKPFIRSLSVKDLPGVGYATSEKLRQLNIQTCADLEIVSLYELQKEFGKKNGQQLYDMSRGIDHNKLNLEHIRKSVSAEVNYGIRFENSDAAHEFLKKLSLEISDRLKKVNLKGKSINLKGMFRAKEAPNEPKKFMGHGHCDIINKSKNLFTATDDPVIITREVLHLWNQLNQNPADARGIGIQITKLEAKNKSHGSTLLKFIDKNKSENKRDHKMNSLTNVNIINEQNRVECDIMKFQDSNKDRCEEVAINNNHNSLEANNIIESTENQQDTAQSNKKNLNNLQNKHERDNESINPSMEDQNSKLSSQLKQTRQSEYFKQIKPHSKAGKIKIPDINEIDMKVLIELPETIRNEILNEYKESNKSIEKSTTIEQHCNRENKSTSSIRLDSDLSFSQIDPEFIAALPNEIKNEIKSYYDNRKKRKIQSEEKRIKNFVHKGWDMFKSDKKPNKNEKLKSHKPKINNAGRKKKKNDAVSSCKPKAVEVAPKKMMVQEPEKIPKAKAINNSFHFDLSSGNLEHSKMLTNIVNCLLELPISQVKVQIREWILNNSDVNNVDFLTLTTYLGILPKKRRIEDLYILLRCLNRIISESKSCIWHETYKKMLEHIQARMRLQYTYDIMIPEQIACDKCMITKV